MERSPVGTPLDPAGKILRVGKPAINHYSIPLISNLEQRALFTELSQST